MAGLLDGIEQSYPGLMAKPLNPSGLFGYGIRDQLYPGEKTFFQGNPNVGGMASESGHIILNPYSPEEVNKDAVAKNEALRLLLRDRGVTPEFDLTDEQRQSFAGTPYASDDSALKSSIAGRIYSGDPSAKATPIQTEWLNKFLMGIGQ
jgi:hypothetical protein